MRITAVTAHVVKAGTPYHPVSGSRAGEAVTGTDYFRMSPYPQLYSRRAETVIVRIDTDAGIVGWGESQAPIGPEVVATVVAKIVGPIVLGRDPQESSVLLDEMVESSRVRGHGSGYQLDAIAGIDTALWDIRGKIAGRSVSTLLGGRFRDELPAYASGLRAPTAAARRDEASALVRAGFGVKPFLGAGVRADLGEMAALRDAVGDDAWLFADALWAYRVPDAHRLAAELDRLGFAFLEAPCDPDDIGGHARLSGAVALPIAVGEATRGVREFLPWLRAAAVDVCQPDLMRNGITEIVRIAELAQAFHTPVALHVGACSVVGMAATWQVAATLGDFLAQEHQPVMFEVFNPWLEHPLEISNGALQVPAGPGLGIEIDEDRFGRDVVDRIRIELE